jgi:hypothetical protein
MSKVHAAHTVLQFSRAFNLRGMMFSTSFVQHQLRLHPAIWAGRHACSPTRVSAETGNTIARRAIGRDQSICYGIMGLHLPSGAKRAAKQEGQLRSWDIT